MSPIATARYDLDAIVEAIVQLIDRTDGKTMVKPNWNMGAADGQPGRVLSALIEKGGDWLPHRCSREVVCWK